MGIKRPIEENGEESEKKTKVDEPFPMELFIRNLRDPESSFLGTFTPFRNRSIFFFSSKRIQRACAPYNIGTTHR